MNLNFDGIKRTVMTVTGPTLLQLEKHSPEILLGAGLVGFGVTVFMASKATLKAGSILEERAHHLDDIHTAAESFSDQYSDEDKTRDLIVVNAKAAGQFIKLYAPSIAMATLSVGCILASHNILNKRNLGLIAAYKVLDEAFTKYRLRVAEEHGAEHEHDIRFGITEETVTEVTKDEDGKKVKTKKTTAMVDPEFGSEYARFFDDSSIFWQKDPVANLLWITQAQNNANDLLYSRGHVFLNEVYDMLGFDRTPAGQVVGWVRGNADGDQCVDFGMYDPTNERKRAFLQRNERVILLDFNVQGVVYDMI